MTSLSAATCGKYQLERELASGGMGTIWVAFDPQLRRRVALKRLRAESLASPDAAQRFEREALAIARLQSPNVVHVYDYGVSDQGEPYIAMELLEGQDLSRAMERMPRWSPAAFGPVMTQVARALSQAHAVGVVHRDLKPANIFLARSGAEEVVKVLDFGIAAMEEGTSEGGRPGSLGIVGTPQYMSPEQVRGRPVDGRSDLWSLAVVAYQALTGRLPFSAATIRDLVVAISADPIPKPSSVAFTLGPRVDQFFARALARDPGDRFATAREMAAAFAALEEPDGAKRTARILVVDDEPDMGRLVKQRLRRKIKSSEYELLLAENGEEALEALRRNPDIDVVLSDIRMPRMDGLTFLAHAAENSPLAKVVMVSAFGDMANIRQAMNSGAFDFLIKPVNLDDLEATVDKAVRHAEELRRAVAHVEENTVLRMFVHGGILERLLPALRRSDATPGEAMDATIAVVQVKDSDPDSPPRSEPAAPPPHATLDRLNESFDAVLPEIVARGGTVHKFVGGALVSVFHGDGHAERAAEACLSARAELVRRAIAKEGSDSHGRSVAIGLESGEVVGGTVGSKSLSRFDYTVMGQAVQTALDLAALAHHGEILVGDVARSLLPDPYAIALVDEGAARGPAARSVHALDRRARPRQDTTSLNTTVGLRRDDTALTEP